MDRQTGFCGYKCYQCEARCDDADTRAELADGWRRIFGRKDATAQSVQCRGCRQGGSSLNCNCLIRPCAEERGVSNCADCPDFPCDKISHLVASRQSLLISAVDVEDVSEEDYNLCCRQFESMPGLIQTLVKGGRLPAWVLQRPHASDDEPEAEG